MSAERNQAHAYVRVVRLKGDPTKVDEHIRHWTQEILPLLKKQPGFTGASLTGNRQAVRRVRVGHRDGPAEERGVDQWTPRRDHPEAWRQRRQDRGLRNLRHGDSRARSVRRLTDPTEGRPLTFEREGGGRPLPGPSWTRATNGSDRRPASEGTGNIPGPGHSQKPEAGPRFPGSPPLRPRPEGPCYDPTQ